MIPKETPNVNLIIPTVSVNAVTKSQGPLLLKDVTDKPTMKAKGKQVMKDELAEQRKLAARLIEEFAKLKPEQSKSSSARQFTRIAPKLFAEQKKVSNNGVYQYVLKQAKAEIKGEPMVTEVYDKRASKDK